jgi:hypothetical protein
MTREELATINIYARTRVANLVYYYMHQERIDDQARKRKGTREVRDDHAR